MRSRMGFLKAKSTKSISIHIDCTDHGQAVCIEWDGYTAAAKFIVSFSLANDYSTHECKGSEDDGQA